MNMTTVPSNQIKAMQQEIESLKEQLAQLRIEADFNFEQYQDAGRLMFELKEVTEQQAEAIRLKDEHILQGNLSLALSIQPSPEILQARDEPVAYLDANYGFMRCGNAADHLPIGTKLYAVPPQPAPSVPEGYQLVPIEPTEAMQEAWDGESSLMGTWNAMLSAARSE